MDTASSLISLRRKFRSAKVPDVAERFDLIRFILSFGSSGEVAEWPKAAVC